MTTIAALRTGLAEAVATTGLHCEAYEHDTIVAPGAQIARGEMDPRLVLGGTKQEYAFKVRVYVSRAVDEQAQVTLDACCEMTGATSIRAALEDGDNYTAALFHYVEVIGVSQTFAVERASGEFLMVEFDVRTVF